MSDQVDERTARARLLESLPATERRLTVADVPTTVLEGGDGPPLILLQGGIECGGAYWAPAIPSLAQTHRVLVPDLPGLGESTPLPRMDAGSFSAWLGALIRDTCEEEPTLIAHSLAGSLAARFAAREGEVLRRLVLYGAPGVGPYRMPLTLRVLAIRFTLRPTERNGERFERYAFHDLERARSRDPAWFDAFSTYTRLRARVRSVKRTMGELVKAGVKPVPDANLSRITVPTSLLWGRHDRFVPLDLAEGASTRLGWPLDVVDRCGHVPHLEHPEAFLHAVRSEIGEPSRAAL
jgi:pimeloyl-ACP methyl ester carboxylesterase